MPLFLEKDGKARLPLRLHKSGNLPSREWTEPFEEKGVSLANVLLGLAGNV